jgi:hypothetical protein
MTRDDTAKLLTMMRAQWQRTKIEDADAMLSAYHLGLADVSYQDGEIAVASCIRECTFFPVVAEIRERLPRSATALAAGDASKRAPRSAFELGYLPWPENGSLVSEPDLTGVPTLADILARDGKAPKELVALPAAIGARKELAG